MKIEFLKIRINIVRWIQLVRRELSNLWQNRELKETLVKAINKMMIHSIKRDNSRWFIHKSEQDRKIGRLHMMSNNYLQWGKKDLRKKKSSQNIFKTKKMFFLSQRNFPSKQGKWLILWFLS